MRNVVRLALVAGAVAMTTITVSADESAVTKRQTLMKETVKPNMGVVGEMIKPQGGAPFDAAKAKEALLAISAVPAEFVKHFPEGSGIGGAEKTAAKPEIWQDMDDFKKKAEEMSAAAKSAADEAEKGKDALAAAFRGPLLGACKSCHEKYKASEKQ